jgi:hypothetical protein
MIRGLGKAFLLLGIASGIEAQQPAKTNADDLPPALVVVEGAQDVRIGRPQPATPPRSDLARDLPGVVIVGPDGSTAATPAQDRWYVSYTLKQPYPAAGFLAEVGGRLEKAGWQPLPMDWVKWSRPSSLTVGWKLYPDYKEPKGQFYWTAAWRNSAGDLLDYKLNYDTRLPEGGAKVEKPDSDVLRVYAALTRGKLVPVESLPPALVIVKEARVATAWVDHGGSFDSLGVRYSVRAPYPATEVLADVSERLRALGWESTPTEGPDSGTPAESPGWRTGPDDYGRPTAEVFRWRGQWRNKAGDKALYTLTYESGLSAPGSRAAEPDNAELHVEAIQRSKLPSSATQTAPADKPRESRFYTSPSGSFRVRIPSTPGEVRISEKAPLPGIWRVSFGDEMCRLFMLEERSGGLAGGSLDAWVDHNLVPRMKAAKIELKDRKSLNTARGPAVLLRILQPGASPCTRSVVKDGQRQSQPIDLDAGMYILYTGNRVYIFEYGTSADDKTTSLFTGSVDEVLARFVEDFEVLNPAPGPKTSKGKP